MHLNGAYFLDSKRDRITPFRACTFRCVGILEMVHVLKSLAVTPKYVCLVFMSSLGETSALY